MCISIPDLKTARACPDFPRISVCVYVCVRETSVLPKKGYHHRAPDPSNRFSSTLCILYVSPFSNDIYPSAQLVSSSLCLVVITSAVCVCVCVRGRMDSGFVIIARLYITWKKNRV